MRKWSLGQLNYADAMCYPEDAEKLLKKHCPDTWRLMYYDFMHTYDRDINRLFLAYSRADYDRGLGEQFDAIIAELVGDYE